jgi:hypothetical protein
MVRFAMKTRAFVSVALLIAWFAAMTLADTPALHERVHTVDAQHQCATTLLASGSYEHAAAQVVLSVLQDAQQFANIAALNRVWVAAPFLGASIFEHAPPALS